MTSETSPDTSTSVGAYMGMGMGAAVAILAVATALYLVWGGPLWEHLGQSEFIRILVSYGLIPLLVVVVQIQRGTLALSTFLTACGVIGGTKLVLTALLDLLFDLEVLR